MENTESTYSYRSLGFFPSEDGQGIDARLWLHAPFDKRSSSDGRRMIPMTEVDLKAADEYALASAATLHSVLANKTEYQSDGTINIGGAGWNSTLWSSGWEAIGVDMNQTGRSVPKAAVSNRSLPKAIRTARVVLHEAPVLAAEPNEIPPDSDKPFEGIKTGVISNAATHDNTVNDEVSGKMYWWRVLDISPSADDGSVQSGEPGSDVASQ